MALPTPNRGAGEAEQSQSAHFGSLWLPRNVAETSGEPQALSGLLKGGGGYIGLDSVEIGVQ